MMRLKPGDLAVVVNSRWPSNNGRLVVIQDIWPPRIEAPYQIRPVDGQPLVVDGEPCNTVSIFSAERYLRPLPSIDPVERDEVETVLSQMLLGSLSKNPMLAAKQRRLLEALSDSKPAAPADRQPGAGRARSAA